MPHDSLRHILPIILLLSSLGLVGCTSSSGEFGAGHYLPWATHHQVVRSGTWMLSNKAPVCLLHGSVADAPASSSGQLTRALQSALSRHFQVVILPRNTRSASTLSDSTFQESSFPEPSPANYSPVNSPENTSFELKTAVTLSGEHGCGVLMVSQVLNQRDEMNSLEEIHRDQESYPERTFKADQLLARIILYSATGAVLDIATVASETGGWTLHRRSPEDLLEQAMQAYVAHISSTARHG